jgi:hypothetical protein
MDAPRLTSTLDRWWVKLSSGKTVDVAAHGAKDTVDFFRGSANRLGDPQHVSFAVAKPCRALADALARIVALDLGDPAGRSESGQVVLLEADPAGGQLVHVASMSSTFRAICVDVPGEALADAKSPNSSFAARAPALGR